MVMSQELLERVLCAVRRLRQSDAGKTDDQPAAGEDQTPLPAERQRPQQTHMA